LGKHSERAYYYAASLLLLYLLGRRDQLKAEFNRGFSLLPLAKPDRPELPFVRHKTSAIAGRDLEELRNDQSRTAGCDFLLALARYRVVIPSVALVRTRSTLSRNTGSLSPDC
jgi:hypothetical protein